jgi:predicted transcriptional regulator of viral defense system
VIDALDIRDQVPLDWLDYQQLVAILSRYAKPRDRISALLADGSLVRVRKGLYVFGERYRREPISREVLANLVYGPSYVSLDFALSHYGLIPERVEDVTSVTTGEKKVFTTPLGVFSYQPLSVNRYAQGIRWTIEGDVRYLIASPEKALVDKVWMDKRFKLAGRNDLEAYLLDDLRMDEDMLQALDKSQLARLAEAFGSKKIRMLVDFLAGSHE